MQVGNHLHKIQYTLHFSGFNFGKVEDIVDQLRKGFPSALDVLQIDFGSLGQSPLFFLIRQNLTETDNGIKGGCGFRDSCWSEIPIWLGWPILPVLWHDAIILPLLGIL